MRLSEQVDQVDDDELIDLVEMEIREQLSEFEAYRSRYEKMLLAILRGGVRSGEFRDIDVDSIARSILQLLNITRWYRPGGSKSAADFAAESFDLVYRSLVAREVEVPSIKK